MSCETDTSATQVLVVDDELYLLEMLTDALSSYGYQARGATDADKALQLAREHRFDIALCDLRMQDSNGIDLTQALCRMHPQLPVVIMTAYGDLETSRDALKCGAADFIIKPFEITTLPFVLENNLQRKKLEASRLSEQRADVLYKAIKSLAAAIDAKSHYTGCHSARMADICLAIGQEVGLAEDRMNTLELAAHIHDVGKIGTPDSVLAKPGKLSEEEWQDVLKHPGMGADFLAGIDELSEVASIIRHHHERMDGSGYPDGLSGEAIPFLARILAVADAFEAMTSDRPYRASIGTDEALIELRANSGAQFDPKVVDAMTKVVQNLFPDEGITNMAKTA